MSAKDDVYIEPLDLRVPSASTPMTQIGLFDNVSNLSDTFGVGTVGPFPLDTIQAMDCVVGMKALPDDSVDLAIADPPYNASKGNVWKWDNSVHLPGFGGDWSKVMAEWDNMSLTEYFPFTVAWLSELKRVVRPTGSLWVHGTYHNIGIINFALQLLGIEIINEVIWYKRNSFPNLSGRRLTASHETILWAHTGKRRQYFFNYEAAKQMPCPEDALREPGKQMRTVWDIPNNKHREEIRYGKHPTQKPLRLLKRMLQLSAKRGQIVLVPFAGTGSECVAARALGLHFLGFETDPHYVDICRKRLGQSSSNLGQSSSQEAKGKTAANAMWKPREPTSIPSLVKWTGSKRSQACTIAAHMPEYRRYFEPFLGGGALLYLAGRPGSVAGDTYEPLVALWRLMQNEPMVTVDDYARQWKALQDNLPDYYYMVRDRFNKNPNPLDLNFLTRTCVNGIVRFNHKGQFNNSFHLSRRGMEPAQFAKVVDAWHQVIQGVRFVCQDYAETVAEAERNDFVYLDPPYAGNHQRYLENVALERLFSTLEELNRRQIKWALSFDGTRGCKDFSLDIPKELYRRRLLLPSGNSAVCKVLNGPVELVHESLYLNY